MTNEELWIVRSKNWEIHNLSIGKTADDAKKNASHWPTKLLKSIPVRVATDEEVVLVGKNQKIGWTIGLSSRAYYQEGWIVTPYVLKPRTWEFIVVIDENRTGKWSGNESKAWKELSI